MSPTQRDERWLRAARVFVFILLGLAMWLVVGAGTTDRTALLFLGAAL
ncbi:hypothetical protein [Halomonas sp. WWR20]